MSGAAMSGGDVLGFLHGRSGNSHLPPHSLQRRLLERRLSSCRSLHRAHLLAHFGCVNAIEFSPRGDLLLSGGDDRRVLLWHIEESILKKKGPICMCTQHLSNIFCVAFDSGPSRVFSAGNDDTVILHELSTGQSVDIFPHDQPVYGVSVDPSNDNVFASACDNGHILIFDIREPPSTDPFCLASYSTAFHSVTFNPMESRLLATANSKEGIGLWDIRQPQKVVVRYGGNGGQQSCMSVRFNGMGTQLLALRRRLPPVLYAIHSPSHLCQFDHPGYYNSCTMKSCCFAGDSDQYVLSGSDDFNLYMWKVPPEELGVDWVDRAHLVLRGHRSIVNQVRFNKNRCIVASSGVEKLIKLWSPFNMANSGRGCANCSSPDRLRPMYTHEDYVNLVLRSGQFMSHDYSHHSTKEDPRMMAFFDSLVQREIEGWSSAGSTLSTEEEEQSTHLEVVLHTSSGSPPSSDSSSSSEENDTGASREVARTSTSRGRRRSTPPNSHGENNQSGVANNRISVLLAKRRRRQLQTASRSVQDIEPQHQRKRPSCPRLIVGSPSSAHASSPQHASNQGNGVQCDNSASSDSEENSPNTRAAKSKPPTRCKRRRIVPYDSSDSSNEEQSTQVIVPTQTERTGENRENES